MPRISLTDFVDIVSASGTSRAIHVRQIKTRPAYSPAFDYWKRLREGIVSCHQAGDPRGHLEQHVGEVNERQEENYAAAMKAYRKWWGHKAMQWFAPPAGLFSGHGVDVTVNPEIGLNFNGQPHVIKLYFKADPLTKNRIDIATHLMQVTLGANATGSTLAVLDVRRSKLFAATASPDPLIGAMLNAELAYVATIWDSL